MDLCFFTMANNKRLDWARRLISSGDAVERPIWFYRIPEDHPDPKRFKIELLMGDNLPVADKYIYLDSDTIMLKHGDWESAECVGAVSEERFKISHRNAFRDKKGFDENGYEAFCKMYREHGCIEKVNTGCVVLPASIRKETGKLWLEWCERVESFCEKPMCQRDQPQFPFVMKDLDIPVLPGKFCAIIKREVVTPEHILLHASGHPGGNARKQYDDVVSRVLGGYLDFSSTEGRDRRWQVLTRLILQCAEDPTYPVGAEVGVFRGQNAGHLLRTFPGLRLHCIDNRQPPGAERRYKDALEVWKKVVTEYGDRIVDYCCDSTAAVIDEPLDFVFIDADHRRDAVLKDIQYYFPIVKMGGVIAGHDIDFRGTYYDRNSVRSAVESVFGSSFETGPDHTWWTFKRSEAL